jgi:hypothetical protein
VNGNNTVTDHTAFTITGTVQGTSTVLVDIIQPNGFYFFGQPQAATVNPDGTWSFTLPGGLPNDGSFTVLAQPNQFGQPGFPHLSENLTVMPPPSPAITINLPTDTVTNQIVTGNVINTTAAADGVTFSGTETGVVHKVETQIFDSSGNPVVVQQIANQNVELDATGGDLALGTWAAFWQPVSLEALPTGKYTFEAFLDPSNVLNPIAGTSSATDTTNILIDQTTPVLQSVTETASHSGTLVPGDTVSYTLHFSGPVSAFSLPGAGENAGPELFLSDGGIATISGGNNSANVTFTETITAQDHATNNLQILETGGQAAFHDDSIDPANDPLSFNGNFVPTFSKVLNLQPSQGPAVAIHTLTETAAQLENLTPAQLDTLHSQGFTTLQSTGPQDTEFSAAQVKALETDGFMVSGPAGAQMELSDSAANVLSLLNGHTFADLAAGLQKLEKVGVTDMDVTAGQHVFDVHVDTLLHEVTDLLALHAHEPSQAQEHQIAQAFNHLDHGLFHL